MKSVLFSVPLLAIAVSSASVMAATASDDLVNISLGSGGLKVTKGDSKFQMGGRIHMDFAQVNEEKHQDNYDTGTGVRRARLYAKGNVGADWRYKFQYDYADQVMKDMYIQYNGLAAGNILVGQFAPPMFMDSYTSSNWTTFVERAVVNNFALDRELGVGFNSAGSHHSIYTGITGDNMAADEEGDDTVSYTTRMTLAPINGNGSVLHLGVTGSYEDLDGRTFYVGQRPATKSVSSTKILSVAKQGESRRTVGGELAFAVGSFSAQAEHMTVEVEGFDGSDDETYTAAYGQASYFLTGESRSYYVDGGVFDAPSAMKNSWEVAVRYEEMDVSDAEASVVDGYTPGKLTAMTYGVNFYPNKNIRFIFNYMKNEVEYLDKTKENVDVIQLRSQLVF